MPGGTWLTLSVDEEVAILPRSDSPAKEVLNILRVSEAGQMFIHLEDGQMYHRIGGAALDRRTFIVPATDQHRAALKAKRKPSS